MGEIKTAAELDALPVRSIGIDDDGDAWQKYDDGWHAAFVDAYPQASREIPPLTVLYRPDAEPVSVLPIVEAVAREIDPESWRYYDTGILPPTHPGALAVVRKSKEAAERVLKLFPGRTEAEVKAEALEEAADKWGSQIRTGGAGSWLRDRAAAIRAGDPR